MNKFIVLEGLDGCGKTTLAKRLAAERNGLYTFEPSDSVIGKLIREILSGRERVSARSLAALFAADRAEHVTNVILPTIDKGVTVFCDRFYLSNMAFQGLEMDAADVLDINRRVLPPLFTPDLTVFINVTPAECIKRISRDNSRVTRDIFEREETLAAINNKYIEAIKLLNGENIITVNGMGSIDETYKLIVEVLGDV